MLTRSNTKEVLVKFTTNSLIIVDDVYVILLCALSNKVILFKKIEASVFIVLITTDTVKINKFIFI